jgi:hypothetical protein
VSKGILSPITGVTFTCSGDVLFATEKAFGEDDNATLLSRFSASWHVVLSCIEGWNVRFWLGDQSLPHFTIASKASSHEDRRASVPSGVEPECSLKTEKGTPRLETTPILAPVTGSDDRHEIEKKIMRSIGVSEDDHIQTFFPLITFKNLTVGFGRSLNGDDSKVTKCMLATIPIPLIDRSIITRNVFPDKIILTSTFALKLAQYYIVPLI